MAFGLLWMPMDEGGQHPPTSVPHRAAPHVCPGDFGEGDRAPSPGLGVAQAVGACSKANSSGWCPARRMPGMRVGRPPLPSLPAWKISSHHTCRICITPLIGLINHLAITAH